MRDLAALDHGNHHLPCLLRDREAEPLIARQKACHAQYAQRVFAEGTRDMTQHTRLEIRQATIGVYHLALTRRAVERFGHGIDGQVATNEVLFQRHIGAGMHAEADIPVAGLALGTRQRVLLLGLRMQEDREVPPDRPEATRLHVFHRRAHHHEVTLVPRPTQARITHRAAHAIDLKPAQQAVTRIGQ